MIIETIKLKIANIAYAIFLWASGYRSHDEFVDSILDDARREIISARKNDYLL